jgi:hemerythrin superfamily protein
MTAKSKIQSATHAVAKVLGTEPKDVADVDVLDTLKKEHEEVQALIDDLQDAEGAAKRKSLLKQIRNGLIPHTKAEEKVVYDAIISTREDEAEVHGLEGYLEHLWAAKTLEKLEKSGLSDAEFKATAKVLKDLVDHHIEEEESEVWSDVREHFDADDRKRMNVAFEAAKRRVKLS